MKTLTFADDVCIAAEDPYQVQRTLSVLSIWCEDAGMRVNISNTKMMKFRQTGRLGKTTIFYQQRPIEIVSEFKYLGVTMQPGLGFSLHVKRFRKLYSRPQA